MNRSKRTVFIILTAAAAVAAALGSPAAAENEYEAWQELAEKNEAVLTYNIGLLHHRRGELDEALREYSHALELDPRFAKAYQNRGAIRLESGDLEGAVEDFTLAVRYDPGLTVAYYNRALAWEKQGRLDKALADLERALRRDPDNEHYRELLEHWRKQADD